MCGHRNIRSGWKCVKAISVPLLKKATWNIRVISSKTLTVQPVSTTEVFLCLPVGKNAVNINRNMARSHSILHEMKLWSQDDANKENISLSLKRKSLKLSKYVMQNVKSTLWGIRKTYCQIRNEAYMRLSHCCVMPYGKKLFTFTFQDESSLNSTYLQREKINIQACISIGCVPTAAVAATRCQYKRGVPTPP